MNISMAPFLSVTSCHINCLRQSQNINSKMKFNAGNFFAWVKTIFFCCICIFYTFWVNNDKRSLKMTTTSKAFNFYQFFLKFCPTSFIRLWPNCEVNQFPTWKIFRQHSPLNPTAKNVQHRTQNIVQIIFSWACFFLRILQIVTNNFKLFTCYVTRVIMHYAHRLFFGDFSTFFSF